MESAFRDQSGQEGFHLIETVLWTGTEAPLWPYHLERLHRSFDLLGWGQPQVPTLPRPKAAARLRLSMAQTPSGGG